MRTYELVTILSPMLNQDQAVEAWDRIKAFITDREAEITRDQTWGTRCLAYPIRKGSYNFLEGSYYLTQFATERPFNRMIGVEVALDCLDAFLETEFEGGRHQRRADKL